MAFSKKLVMGKVSYALYINHSSIFSDAKRSKEIDEQLQKDKKEHELAQKGTSQIMLLGSGDSGKSTVLKQLQILHGGGFSKEDSMRYKNAAIENILDIFLTLVILTRDLGIDIEEKNQTFACRIEDGLDFKDMICIPKEIVTSMVNLWNDKGIRACLDRGNEFCLQDTASYFLDAVEMFADPRYTLTNEDILRVRIRTPGVTKTEFLIKEKKFTILDVGGQKSLRQFWVPYFSDSLTAIIFVASLASYDQVLEEDGETNRMEDSLDLFQKICANKSLQRLSVILFLNKADLFEQKIESSPLSKWMLDYNEPSEQQKSKDKHARNFIRDKYISRGTTVNKKKHIFAHFTTSTDSNLMKVVISSVFDIIMRKALGIVGLI